MAIPARARWILVLLLQGEDRRKYNQPVLGRTRLLKELFLLKNAFGIKDVEYEFVPFWYGPFSPEAFGDLQALLQEGAVVAERSTGGDSLSLSPAGVELARPMEKGIPPEQLARIRDCKERFNAMPLDELVDYVYGRWPQYTDRSLRSPSTAFSELRKQARAANITEEEIKQAIAEYRAQTPSR